jgi:hypothetical protein
MPDRQVSVWSNPQRAALNGRSCEALSVELAGADRGAEKSRQCGAAFFGIRYEIREWRFGAKNAAEKIRQRLCSRSFQWNHWA